MYRFGYAWDEIYVAWQTLSFDLLLSPTQKPSIKFVRFIKFHYVNPQWPDKPHRFKRKTCWQSFAKSFDSLPKNLKARQQTTIIIEIWLRFYKDHKCFYVMIKCTRSVVYVPGFCFSAFRPIHIAARHRDEFMAKLFCTQLLNTFVSSSSELDVSVSLSCKAAL